jgi:acyl-CoA dehydrogenase
MGARNPGVFRTSAARDGDGWVLDGYKFFSSNAATASLFIVLAVTAPDQPLKHRMSMFLVPGDTSGVVLERRSGVAGEPPEAGTHPLVHHDHVRLHADRLLGQAGDGFLVAQARLGAVPGSRAV